MKRSLLKFTFLTPIVSMVYLLALTVVAPAQGVTGDSVAVPSSPQSHVLDDADLFRESPESRIELEGSLRRIRDDFGCLPWCNRCTWISRHVRLETTD